MVKYWKKKKNFHSDSAKKVIKKSSHKQLFRETTKEKKKIFIFAVKIQYFFSVKNVIKVPLDSQRFLLMFIVGVCFLQFSI